jgi:hypothetical protein
MFCPWRLIVELATSKIRKDNLRLFIATIQLFIAKVLSIHFVANKISVNGGFRRLNTEFIELNC